MKNYELDNLEILDWGLLDYEEAFHRQKRMVEERIQGCASDRLVLVEHPPVVTIGRRGSLRDLNVSGDSLRRRGVALFDVDRGGMTTFHGPGQLVAYPIVMLRNRDLHEYVQTLLKAAADLLERYGLNPEFREGEPGIWVNSAKIASIGIAVRKWVSYHGIAVNVNTDLQTFEMIVPCGQPEERITSMAMELRRPVKMHEVKERFIESFAQFFGYGLSKEKRVRSWWQSMIC
jgi:lipoate-protein ligase B